MRDSGNFAGDVDVPNLATGYSRLRLTLDGSIVYEAGPRRNTWFMQAIGGSPAGGTYSTVGDLGRFARALVVSTFEGRSSFTEAFRLLGFKKMATFRELGSSLGVGI